MTTHRPTQRMTVATILLALTCAATANATPPETTEPVEAIWGARQLVFNYSGSQTHYSCAALGQKVMAILTAVGVREDVAVTMSCSSAVTNQARIQIALAAPVAATAANVAAATSFNGRDNLLARVRGIPLPTANDIERFPAQWQSVKITSLRGMRITAADCELLRGMTEQLFPQLSIQVTRQSLSCGALRVKPTLAVVALIRVPEVPLAFSDNAR